MGRNHSGPKHLSHALNPIEPPRGRWEKLDVSTALGSLNCTARSQHPFCESLRIHENEIARGQAKTVSQSESINLNSSILKEACQNEGAKQATRRPSDIN